MTSIVNHISDKARYISFDPGSTDWASDILDVQAALANIGSYAMKDTGLPLATERIAGIAKLATLEEARDGRDHTTIITPFTLKDIVDKPEATTTDLGTVILATSAIALEGTDPNKVITAGTLKYVTDNRRATETVIGTSMVATNDQAIAGTDNSAIMTPKKVKLAINELAPKEATASESVKGITKLATDAEVQAGTAREGVAISPYQFARAKATATFSGTFKAAGDSQMTTLTSAEHAVTPYALGRTKAEADKFGIVKLATAKTDNPNTALSANANVVFQAGSSMNGDLTFGNLQGVKWDTGSDTVKGSIIINKDHASHTCGLAFELDQVDASQPSFTWTCKKDHTSEIVMDLNSDYFTINHVSRVNLNAPVYENGNRLLTQGLRSVELNWGQGRHLLPRGTVFVSGYVQCHQHSGHNVWFHCYDSSGLIVYSSIIGRLTVHDGDGGEALFGFQYFIPSNARYVEIVRVGGSDHYHLGIAWQYALTTS